MQKKPFQGDAPCLFCYYIQLIEKRNIFAYL